MDLEAENRMLREALLETQRRALALGYTGLAAFIDTALGAPERPAEQILEQRFPYLRESRAILARKP